MRIASAQLSKIVGIAVFSAVFPLLEASPALADDVIIHMKSGPNRFQEKVVQVKVGDRLIWNNLGGSHTATPDDNQTDPFPDTGNVPLNGTSTPWEVKGAPRTIKYHCEVHGAGMSGEIIVLP